MSDARDLDLKVGHEVDYLARFFGSEEPIRIIEIRSISNETWDDGDFDQERMIEKLQNNNPLLFKERERILHGCIVEKVGGEITIKLNDYSEQIQINVDKVKLSFQPMKGDDISALANVQTDSTKKNFLGAILNFKRIGPLRSNIVRGSIDRMPGADTKHGIIDDSHIFFANALDNAENYERKIVSGDQVIAEAISGVYKFGYREYNWRCIKIIHHDERRDDGIAEKLEQHVDNECPGISVTSSADLSVSLYRIDDDKPLKIKIKNQSKTMRQLMKIELVDRLTKISIVSHDPDLTYKLEPKASFVLLMTVTGRCYGKTYDFIRFTFDECSEPVVRMIVTNVDCQLKLVNDNDNVYTIEKNYQYTRSVMRSSTHVMKGEKVRNAPNFIEIKLKPFEVPTSLADIVFSSQILSQIELELESVMPSFAILDESNYEMCMHYLLYLEELQQIHCMRRYDRDQAYFIPQGQYLTLEMQNIMETRPSLIAGKKNMMRI